MFGRRASAIDPLDAGFLWASDTAAILAVTCVVVLRFWSICHELDGASTAGRGPGHLS